MKIGIDAQRIFRKRIHGMEVVIIEIIKELQRLDTTNEYVVYVRQNTVQRIFSTSNFKITIINASSFAIWEQWLLPRQVKRDGVDILHCTSNTAPIFYKKKLMITLHDIIYLEKLIVGGTYYQRFGNLYRKLIVPLVVKSANLILTVSEYEKGRIIKQFSLPNNMVKVVYNGLNERFKLLDVIAVGEAGKYIDMLPRKFILHLGNTAEKKNTKRVVNAYCGYCESVSEPMPLVVTDLAEELIDTWLDKESLSKIKKHIIVLPYIQNDDMPYLYGRATILLYPSLRESFGMPILEAMSCGTPVITSNTSSMPEISGGASILVDPLSKQDIQDSLIELTQNHSLLDELRVKGIKRASKFSWRIAAKEYLESYYALAQQ